MEYCYFTYTVGIRHGDEVEYFYGITTGEDYSDAMGNVYEEYCTKDITQIIIEDFDNRACLEMTKSALEDFKNAVNF
jgi:hypothetical protein